MFIVNYDLQFLILWIAQTNTTEYYKVDIKIALYITIDIIIDYSVQIKRVLVVGKEQQLLAL